MEFSHLNAGVCLPLAPCVSLSCARGARKRDFELHSIEHDASSAVCKVAVVMHPGFHFIFGKL